MAVTQPAADIRLLNERIQQESGFVEQLLGQAGQVIVGQRTMIERLLVGLITGGHVLLEGVPGLAKTLTVKTLADCLRQEQVDEPGLLLDALVQQTDVGRGLGGGQFIPSGTGSPIVTAPAPRGAEAAAIRGERPSAAKTTRGPDSFRVRLSLGR